MKDLYELLIEHFKGAKRLVILGVGSFLKADDAAGVIITERLKKYFSNVELSAVSIFTGESAPENCTGSIKKSEPDHILILDAADFKKEPGSIEFIRSDLIDNTSFSTHMLPIKIMLDYLVCETGCGFTILGIQPESLLFTGEVTPKVDNAIDYITSVIEKIIVQFEERYKARNHIIYFKVKNQPD